MTFRVTLSGLRQTTLIAEKGTHPRSGTIMSDSTELSSAAEDRKKRALSTGTSSDPHKKIKVQHDGASSAAASASAAAAPMSRTLGMLSAVAQRASHVDSPLAHQVSSDQVPDMKSLSELLSDCQSLGQNIDGTPYCKAEQLKMAALTTKRKPNDPSAVTVKIEPGTAAAAAASSSSSAVVEDDLSQALRLVRVTQQVDPKGHWLKDELERRIADLPVPEFYDESATGVAAKPSQEQLKEQLQRGQFRLITMSSELESQLLAEAGSFECKSNSGEKTVFNFPPCSNGLKCVGTTLPLPNQTRPCVLTSLMFDDEWGTFVDTGRAPRVSRPCIMCYRHAMAMSVTIDRVMRMYADSADYASASAASASSKDGSLRIRRDVGEIVQIYRNLCDEVGGYHRSDMFVCNGSTDDPILEPICMPNRSKLLAIESTTLFHTVTRKPRLVVDQMALLWQQPRAPVPDLGVNLQSFCGGASRQ